MVEPQMEHKQETKLEKLLHGRAEGVGLALRGCTGELLAALKERFGEDTPQPIRFFDPCRIEHPHSAFLRKSAERNAAKTVQTTLYAPAGRLTEERGADGQAHEWFVKKPHDFEVLRGFLKDVDLHPAKAAPVEGAAMAANLGLTPVRELETRWAGPEMTRWALMASDEAAASCVRKLERQLHRRAEEAARAGSRACLLKDMATEPLPDTYLAIAGRHIEWLKHAGLFPYVEVSEPAQPLLAALGTTGVGARLALDSALALDLEAVPEGMRLLLDAKAGEGLGEFEPDNAGRLFSRRAGTVVALDCFEARFDCLCKAVEILLEIFRKTNL